MPVQAIIHLFGALSVAVDGCPVNITSPSQQAFIATLAMYAGQSVSLNKICQSVWGTGYSPELEGALRPLVTRTRQRFGIARDLIVTGPSSYKLIARPDDVDIPAFESRAKKGAAAFAARDWQNCLDLLDEAQALWTDDPFASIRSPHLRDQHAASLNAQLSILRPRRAEAFIRASSPRCASEVLYDLDCLIDDSPDDDHLRWLRMLALHRSGNPDRALDDYTQARGYLAEKHGRDPGQELQNLQKLILAADPRLLQTPFRD